MYGWNGLFLRVNLSKMKAIPKKYNVKTAKYFIGGRGFAAKILWDELKPETDPLSPKNKLVFAGPLTGFPLPNSGKLVAAKSPLTNGYGDGNIGSSAAVQMRKAGYDAIIVEGARLMLSNYYRKRGWDERGIPTRTALKNLGLENVAKQLKRRIKMYD